MVYERRVNIMLQSKKVTCSFTMDRELYNQYKKIVLEQGENVKGNLVRYMRKVIDYGTANADTIEAIEEVKKMKSNPSKKTYNSFSELLEDLEDE